MSLLYQLLLSGIKGVGPVLTQQLLNHFGTAERVLKASPAELSNLPGVGLTTARAINQAKPTPGLQAELEFISKNHIAVLQWNKPGYPGRLARCGDAPGLLFYRGMIDLDHPRIVGIVGTRNATHYGKKCCYELVEALQAFDVVVVSGLASGIDTHVHEACLHFGVPTLAVLAHGFDRIYPPVNRKLASRLLREGGLLTEYPSGTKPGKMNFPARNRIIAGLADATVVVEASLKGGALITAELANGYDREVLAFPGSVHAPYSEGCNELIRTHQAHLLRGISDLSGLMGWLPVRLFSSSEKDPVTLTETENNLLRYLKIREYAGIEDLMAELNAGAGELASVLLELELKGLLIALPGKRYRLAEQP